jgi:hypothetical protein
MDRFDVLMVLGITLLAIGCGLIYFPLGLIAGGAGCIAIAIVGARGTTLAPRAARNVATSGKDK